MSFQVPPLLGHLPRRCRGSPYCESSCRRRARLGFCLTQRSRFCIIAVGNRCATLSSKSRCDMVFSWPNTARQKNLLAPHSQYHQVMRCRDRGPAASTLAHLHLDIQESMGQRRFDSILPGSYIRRRSLCTDKYTAGAQSPSSTVRADSTSPCKCGPGSSVGSRSQLIASSRVQ